MFSMTGAIDRHGPHHAAEKSTTAGCCESNTKRSKSLSPTLNNAVCSLLMSLTPLSNSWNRRGFPAAAERLVDQHDRRVQVRLGRGHFVFRLQQRALRIEQP